MRITVVAADAVDAEVLATSLFLAGMDEAAARPTRPAFPLSSSARTASTLLAGGLA